MYEPLQQTLFESVPESSDQHSSAAGFRANLTALQANVWHLMMNVIYGANTQESFARLSPNGCWVKTFAGYCQVKVDGSLEEYCETWPDWGIVSDGLAIQLLPPAQYTKETGFSLWPTLTASEYKGVPRNRYLGSKTYRGDKLASYFRRCESDPCYLNPSYAEVYMGYPAGHTDLRD
jgi:hypothetical protein